jgi:hypothetical protein
VTGAAPEDIRSRATGPTEQRRPTVTVSDAGRPDADAGPMGFVPEVGAVPVDAAVRPMPRLGRGVVWSDVVAEIEHDEEERLRDAA